MAEMFDYTELSNIDSSEQEALWRDLVSRRNPASSSQVQDPAEAAREARRKSKGKSKTNKLKREVRVIDGEECRPMAKHSAEYKEVMQMLTFYACLSGAEKAALIAAGQPSEETLYILAQALNDEDKAYVPVRDADTQTQPEEVVVQHNLQSLLNAIQSLHKQRLAHEKKEYTSGRYQTLVPKTVIEETSKTGGSLEQDERRDVTVPDDALHAPAAHEDPHEQDTVRIAYFPLILQTDQYNCLLIKDSGAEWIRFQPMADQHMLGYQDNHPLNGGIARIDN